MGAKFRYGNDVLVEYTNSPEDFEAQYPDLLRLLGKLHFLSDDNLMELMSPALLDCANDKKGKSKLTLDISETGEASLDEGSGFEQLCTAAVFPLFHFTATGKPRKVSHEYDFSRPLKPAWLADSTYAEERAKPASEKPPEGSAPPVPSPAGPAPVTPAEPSPTSAPGPAASEPVGPAPAPTTP